MTAQKLTLACWDHDRAAAILDGRVKVRGADIASTVLPTSKLYPIAANEARFDITEMSVSTYILQLSKSETPYTAIPVFLSRAFRHNGFFARTGAGIETPADLAGRRVGVPEYQMTAGLWMRGIMSDEYDVDLSGIHWRTGALDAAVRKERLALALPPEIVVEPIADGETLQNLLLAGDIDAILAPAPPRAFREGDPRIFRLFPDFETAERAYYEKTGFFPIMHLVAVRRSATELNPDLPRALYDAFSEAKALAVDRILQVWQGSANRLTLPWLGATMERTLKTMGEDYWSYGFSANKAELKAICRYSAEQHLSARCVTAEEMFHASVLNT